MLPDLRVRQRDYLLEISRTITQELNLDKVLARILTVSIEMLAGQAGLIALREQGGWSVAVSQGLPPAFLEEFDPLLKGISEQGDAEIAEIDEFNHLLQGLLRSTSLGLLAGVALPLLARNRVVGVLFIFRNYLGVFSTNDKNLLQSFADQAAIAVANAQLYKRLRHEERRMAALIDTVADGIFILSSDHIIEHCNPAFARLLGVETDALLQKPHSQVVQWARLREGQNLEQAEKEGWPLTPHAALYVEGDLQRPNQSPVPVGITYAPLLSPHGSLLNVIASVRDITRFREADQLKSMFISVISHELKTPVALIKGYVSTLRREDASWERAVVADSLAVIEEEADHLTVLIEDLLDASRLQSGSLSMNLADVDLAAIAQRVAERFQVQTSKHTIVVDFPKRFPIVMADETRLMQVFSNLLSNAIKYSPKGGEICISGQVMPKQVVVCISDQGPGIAQEDVPYIFDRFYRASGVARTTKGTGLGLYLARAVIEAHNGHIWVDCTSDKGARVCFDLPCAEE